MSEAASHHQNAGLRAGKRGRYGIGGGYSLGPGRLRRDVKHGAAGRQTTVGGQ